MAGPRSLRASAGAAAAGRCATGFVRGSVQTAEGELRIEIPQVREAAEPFVSKLFRKRLHQAAAAHRSAEGDDRRRVRARPVDARRRVAVRGGRAREDLEVDRRAGSARSCASASKRSIAATSTRSSWSCCSSTRSTCRCARGPEGGRDGRLGVHRERRTRAGFACVWGRARPRRTGSSSAATSLAADWQRRG